jgi:hypothetical protein
MFEMYVQVQIRIGSGFGVRMSVLVRIGSGSGWNVRVRFGSDCYVEVRFRFGSRPTTGPRNRRPPVCLVTSRVIQGSSGGWRGMGWAVQVTRSHDDVSTHIVAAALIIVFGIIRYVMA